MKCLIFFCIAIMSLAGCTRAGLADSAEDATVGKLRRSALGEGDDAVPVGAPESVGIEANKAGIFALSHIYGIKPDGTCYELEGGNLDPLRQSNMHWDAGTNTVRLYGAKNEEAAVQLVIPMEGKGFSCRCDGIEGIPPERVSFSTVAWVRTKDGPLVPELVLPLDGSVNSIKTFDVPFEVEGLPKPQNKVGVVLMEVWIPKGAKAGKRKGVVSILKGDEVAARLNVSVTVHGFALPDMPTYRLDLLCYGSPLRRLDMDARIPDGGGEDFQTAPEAIAVEHAAYKLSMDNRAFLNILPYHSQRGNPYYGYPVQGEGGSAKIVSCKGFDERFGPVLDGKTNKYGQPPPVFTLPFNINYPCRMWSEPRRQFDFRPFKNTIPEGPGKDARLKEFEDTYRAVAQQYVGHFAERGWTKTHFEVYYNQKSNPDRNRTPWKLDEPTDGPDYRGLRYLFNVSHWAFEGADKKGVKVITRIDIGHWECDRLLTPEGEPTRCYKAKGYNRDNAQQFLKGVVDRWVAGVTHTEGAQHLIKEYRVGDVMFDQYGTSGWQGSQLGVHSGEFAGIAWKHAVMGVQGRVFYKVDIGSGNPNGPTDHCCLYDGTPMGYKGVLCSRRLKLWRGSVNSYDYIVQARGRDSKGVEALFSKMVGIGLQANHEYATRSRSRGFWFTNNVEDVTRALLVLGALIEGEESSIEIEGPSRKYTKAGVPDAIVGYD